MSFFFIQSDFDSLDQTEVEDNTGLGFDVAEQEFGISPVMSVEEMSSVGEPDTLSMVMYLSQFYQILKDTLPSTGETLQQNQWRGEGRGGYQIAMRSNVLVYL